MIPTYPNWTSVSIKIRDDFEVLTKPFEPYAEFNFECLYAWDTNRKSRISILNGNLIIMMQDYLTKSTFCALIGDQEIDATIDQLLADNKSLEMVPEVVIENILDKTKYIIEEDRDQFDYIYQLEDQVKLPGNHFKGRRNKSGHFIRTHYDYLNMKQSNIETWRDKRIILKIFDNWSKKKCRPRSERNRERKAIKRLLDNARDFSFVTILIFVKNKPVGFTINEIVSEDYAVCLFQKTTFAHRDIDTFLTRTAAGELLHHGLKFVSWEQDLGIEGMRAYKQSYKPIKYLKKYRVALRPSD